VSWSGDLLLDDPDGIVVDAQFVPVESCALHLDGVARWVGEPLLSWLSGDPTGHYAYVATGTERSQLEVRRR
jgi:hypothetical protein